MLDLCGWGGCRKPSCDPIGDGDFAARAQILTDLHEFAQRLVFGDDSGNACVYEFSDYADARCHREDHDRDGGIFESEPPDQCHAVRFGSIPAHCQIGDDQIAGGFMQGVQQIESRLCKCDYLIAAQVRKACGNGQSDDGMIIGNNDANVIGSISGIFVALQNWHSFNVCIPFICSLIAAMCCISFWLLIAALSFPERAKFHP
ncbi:hypothetical protein PSAC2689_30039 [Paraburkholderia sacchari]